MIIGDERFAAALVTATGDALKFDDIGCLIEHEGDRLRPDVAYWVRDSRSGGWLNAREATFVQSPSIVSPMGYGLAALPAAQAPDPKSSVPDRRMLRFHELPGFLTDIGHGPGPEGPKDEADSHGKESSRAVAPRVGAGSNRGPASTS
jgi:copper chaperone NosL